METTKQAISAFNERLNDIERILESTNFNIYHYMVERKCIEELVELSVLEHFEVKRKDFHEKDFSRIGSPKDEESYDKKVIFARQWFMSIMVNMLHRTSYKMAWNYSFFHQKKVEQHKEVFLSGVNGTNKKHRETFVSLCSIIRNMVSEERLLDEGFDFN